MQKADTFKLLIDFYASDVLYDPTAADMKVANMTGLWNQMKAANDGIGLIISPVNQARITRDGALYADGTGIYDLQKGVKKYVKSVFGATSAQAKLVTGIKFTRPRV